MPSREEMQSARDKAIAYNRAVVRGTERIAPPAELLARFTSWFLLEWPDAQKWNPETMAGWTKMLAEFDCRDVEAMWAYLRSPRDWQEGDRPGRRFPPSFNELRERLNTTRDRREADRREALENLEWYEREAQ